MQISTKNLFFISVAKISHS